MKTHFRLYTDAQKDFTSSVFDLISGDNETKQTKGLAYVFSQYPEFLQAFLQSEKMKEKIRQVLGETLQFRKISSIEVSAERLSKDNKRADIILRLQSDQKPLLAIIIEAKSAKVNINQQSLANQIKGYLNDDSFPELKGYKKIGVVLTKYSQTIQDVINLSWNDIVQLLNVFCKKRDASEPIVQYLNFLTGVDKAMYYYEKEVLSVAAGESIEGIEKHCIYVCPNNNKYSYKKPLFMAFRKPGGGVMDKLYKIDDIIVLNRSNSAEIEALRDSTYSYDVKERIFGYIEDEKLNPECQGRIYEDERFYILSKNAIELKHNPKPERNNPGIRYYTLHEILSGKEIIQPESNDE